MTRQADFQCLTPAGSDAAGHGSPIRVETSIEARALEHAESIATPPATPSGPPPTVGDEIELDISSPRLRLFKGRLYIALPDVRPSSLEEEEISDVIKRLEMDLKAASVKIKAKSHRKPSRESSLRIDMRMSGVLERGSTKVKLKPCIWFFCGSRWCRKIVEKDLKKLNWRLPCDLQIVDEGGPFDLLSTSEDSGLDDCKSDASNHAADLDTPQIFEDRKYNESRESFNAFPKQNTSDGYCASISPAHSVAGSRQPSRNSTTHVYNTIDRQGGQRSPYLLPCEFSMAGCDRVFKRDEDNEWIEHIIGHLRDILPRKLRCWYCVQHTFAADLASDESIRINFKIRMQHIRDHILFDTSLVSWARPDMSVIKHLKAHNLVDDQTFHRLATQNTVVSSPEYLAPSTSLRLSDDVVLDFHVQESHADSSIGLTCRSTIRRHNAIISEKFSRMGGVITVTRGSENELYGVTSGHGIVCQILENTSNGRDESDALSDESSQSSVYDGDSGTDKEVQDESGQIYDSSLTVSYEKVEKWVNANHGLMATFLNLRADSVDFPRFCMIPREIPSMEDKISGDLALIRIPSGYARGLRNDFVDPAGPRGNVSRGTEQFWSATKINDGEGKLFVLLSKTRSVAGCLVAGTVHFSVGGRKIECARIMVSEELGLGSSGSWVVRDDVLYGMVIAITPMDGSALILPQRRMYSDIRELFPDASSIVLSSGVREILIEKGKERERNHSDLWEESPELDRQEGKPWRVGITTSVSGTRRRRGERTRYYYQ